MQAKDDPAVIDSEVYEPVGFRLRDQKCSQDFQTRGVREYDVVFDKS